MQQEELEKLLRAFQECRILLTAIELNVFTAMEGGATLDEVMGRIHGEARGTAALLNVLVSMELAQKKGGVFFNAPLASRLLAEQSPECARAAMLHDVERWETWSRLTDRVLGKAQPERHRTLPIDRHQALLAMLDHRSVERAPKLISLIGTEGVHRVLDVGGGSAAYSIAFARAQEGLHADVFDLPEVMPITKEYIAKAGEGHRVHAVPGDLLTDDLGSGYDLVLLFSLTHIFGADENRDLFARCHRALNPGGRLAIHDHILNDDKTQPRAGAVFAINMLVATPTGGTYSLKEYQTWLREAGFTSVEHRPLEGAPTGVLIATH